MAIELPDVFTIDYQREVTQVFQRKGFALADTVMRKDNVTGASTTFPRIGVLSTTGKGRDARVVPQNPDNRQISCTLEDAYVHTVIDKLDEAKTNADIFNGYVAAGAMACGRKCDDTVLTAVDGTTQSGLAFTLTSYGTVRNSLLQVSRAFKNANSYDPGNVYCVLTPIMWQAASCIDSFAETDIAGRPLFAEAAPVAGVSQWKYWDGIWWTSFNATPMAPGTSGAKGFAWHKNAVGFATGAHPQNMAQSGMITGPVGASIQWLNDYAGHSILHMMSLGACLIDDAGAFEITLNESGSVTFPSA